MVFAWHKCLRLLSWEFTSKCHLLIPKLEVSDLENLDLTHSSAGESPLSSRSSKKAVGTRKEKNYRKQSLESGVRNWFGLFSTTQRSNMRHSQKDQLDGCTPISRKKFKGKHEKQPLSLKVCRKKVWNIHTYLYILFHSESLPAVYLPDRPFVSNASSPSQRSHKRKLWPFCLILEFKHAFCSPLVVARVAVFNFAPAIIICPEGNLASTQENRLRVRIY